MLHAANSAMLRRNHGAFFERRRESGLESGHIMTTDESSFFATCQPAPRSKYNERQSWESMPRNACPLFTTSDSLPPFASILVSSYVLPFAISFRDQCDLIHNHHYDIAYAFFEVLEFSWTAFPSSHQQDNGLQYPEKASIPSPSTVEC